jgi:hypothetical protein
MTILDVEAKTKSYADARDAVSAIVSAIEEEIAAVKKRHMARLKKAVGIMAERQAELKATIEDNTDIFAKRRTQVFYGVRVGYMKERGKLVWEDDNILIKLIKKYYPDEWTAYVKVVERPLKSSLEQLSAVELKRLGIQVTEDSNVVFIKSVDSELEKMIDAILHEAEEIKDAA